MGRGDVQSGWPPSQCCNGMGGAGGGQGEGLQVEVAGSGRAAALSAAVAGEVGKRVWVLAAALTLSPGWRIPDRCG